MKKTVKILISCILTLAMLSSFATVFAAEDATVISTKLLGVHSEENFLGDFTDAPEEGSWKYQGINCVVQNGVMNGHAGKLRPDDSLTRAELVAMMVRVLGAHADKTSIEHYVDVVLGAWYYELMESGVAIKIINGDGNKIMPNMPITREQTFTILARTFLKVQTDPNAANKFSDAASVSDWAKASTNALIECNVVLGDTRNTIRPKAQVTRAEFAAMLDRIACYFAKGDVNYKGVTIDGSVILNDANVNLDGAIINGDLIITDAVGDSKINLDNVIVKGDIIIRSGDVNITGDSSTSQVVVGSPVRDVTVKADDKVAVDKVIITENSADVSTGVSTPSVEIQGSDIEVNFESGTEVEDVTVKGDNTTVKVESGAKVENVDVDGAGGVITGNGKVDTADVQKDTKVETQGTKVTVEGEEVKPTPPGGGGGGGGSDEGDPTLPPAPDDLAINEAGTYVSYSVNGGATEKKYADIEGNTITFDLSGLTNLNGTVVQNLFIDTNKDATGGVDCTTAGFHKVSFKTDAEKAVAEILTDMIDSTSNAIAPIIGVYNTDPKTLFELQTAVYDAYDAFNTPSIDNWMQDLFTGRFISFDAENAARFAGKVGTKDVYIVIKVPALPSSGGAGGGAGGGGGSSVPNP